MKSAVNMQLILVLGVLALGGARVPAAAEEVGDGQKQARLLLSGRGAAPSGPKAEFVSPTSTAAKSIPVDAQAQARTMILGRQIEKTPIVDVLHVVGARRARKDAVDPQEMARQLILGSPFAASSAKIRLTSKTE